MRTAWMTVAALTPLVVGLAGCDTLTGPDGVDGHRDVAMTFHAADAPGYAAADAIGAASSPARSVSIEGSNGTLVLETMHVVMEEFELEREDDDDCEADADACEKFEVGPLLVEIPLDAGAAVTAFSATVPEDRYKELEFEIDDLDDDEPGEVELLNEIRDQFPNWPEDASLRVTGTFTPDGGSATEFLAFIAAEVEIERGFEPFLAVTEESGAEVSVTVDPSLWFLLPDGTVVDLGQFHCDPPNVCPVPEFEAEFEREGGEAFTEIGWN